MADLNEGRLKCLLLPLQSGTLLLPNSVVAEIVPAQRHHRGEGPLPDWYIGHIEWRGTTVPLISLETLCDSIAREFPAKTSFVVLRRLNDSGGGEDYYAVYIDGIPHFQFIDEVALQALNTPPPSPYIAHEVSIDGASASIPDLDAVERTLATLSAEVAL